jgi:hypothetical protein
MPSVFNPRLVLLSGIKPAFDPILSRERFTVEVLKSEAR